MGVLEAKLEFLRESSQWAHQEHGLPNHLSCAKLTDDELDLIVSLLAGDEIRPPPPTAQDFKDSAPLAPPVDHCETMEDIAEALPPSCGDLPSPVLDVVHSIARDPGAWARVALAEETYEDPDIIYLILFAKQTPHEVTFLQCRRKPHCPMQVDEDTSRPWYPPADYRQWEWLNPWCCTKDVDLPWTDNTDLRIYRGCFFQGPVVVTVAKPEPIEYFVRFRAPATVKEPTQPTTRRPRTKLKQTELQALVDEHPWARGDLLGEQRKKRRRRLTKTGAAGADFAGEGEGDIGVDEESLSEAPPSEPRPEDEAPEVPEPEEAAGDSDLDEEIREQVREVRRLAGEFPHFKVTPLVKNKRLQDFVLAEPKTKDVSKWAREWGFNRSKRFSTRLYTRAKATRLCNEFCRKGEYYYGVYIAEREFAGYTQAHVDALPRDAEYDEWHGDLDVTDPAFRAAIQVELIQPRLSA